MGGDTLALDSILSATFHFTTKWSSHLQSNKARDLLRYLVCRLYDQGHGNLINAEWTYAQTSLAMRLGVSVQWVGVLVTRLQETGWLLHESEKLANGMNGSSVWRAGPQLKRLCIMLAKSKRRKTPINKPTKSTWYFSPLRREKEILRLLEEENKPPTPEELKKIEANPLLKEWYERGKEAR